MFAPPRELFDTFHRRHDDLQQLDGRDFLLGARSWYRWLLRDERTKMAIELLKAQSDQSRRELNALRDDYLNQFIALKKAMCAAKPSFPEDRVDGKESDSSEHTWKRFDALCRENEPTRFSPHDVSPTPLDALQRVLQSKATEYYNALSEDTGSAKERRVKKKVLADIKFHALLDDYESACREIGAEFWVSSGRILRLFEQFIEKEFGLSNLSQDLWFDSSVWNILETQAVTEAVFSSSSSTLEASDSESLAQSEDLTKCVLFLKPLAQRLQSALMGCLSERADLTSTLDRFRRRCDISPERMRESARAETSQALNQQLLLYLFDAGFETANVHVNSIHIEGKQGGSAKGKQLILDTFRQTQTSTYARSGAQKNVLAVFLLEVVQGRNGSPSTYCVVIDLRESVAQKNTSPVVLTENDFLGATQR
jgi:hypothetical protein